MLVFAIKYYHAMGGCLASSCRDAALVWPYRQAASSFPVNRAHVRRFPTI